MAIVNPRDCAINSSQFRVAARLWGLSDVVVLDDCVIAGSPERCRQRAVLRTPDGERWLLESLHPEVLPRKARIAETLQTLVDGGLTSVYPYRATRRGEVHPYFAGAYWQLMPYLPGEALPRPDWVRDAWRGESLAGFLIALRQVAEGRCFAAGSTFSLPDYVSELMAHIVTCRPDVLPRARLLRDALAETLWPHYDGLRTAFCHGDYHPLNVIWSARGVRAVIDWEFYGTKPALYDLANLIGCVGVEEPSALDGPLVMALLRRLREAAWGCEADWPRLPALVLGVRFAWLSEWLRKDDVPMIGLELDYMEMLWRERDVLASRWGLEGYC